MHRFKRVGFFGVLVAALTLSGVGYARPNSGPGDSHHDPGAFIEKYAEALNLSDETLGAIRGIVEESKSKGDQLHSELRELHEGMKALLSQSTPDETAVMKQVEMIGAAETEMHKHRLETMLAIRALLTPEQREEMTQLREDSRGRWKHALLEDCDADLATLCPEADDRWSRKRCLKDHREEVSEACRDSLKEMWRAHHGSHAGCSEHRGSECPHGDLECSEGGGPGSPEREESGASY